MNKAICTPCQVDSAIASTALCESLEERRFLSATVSFASLSRGGTLTVSGTRHDDVMFVSLERRHPGTLDASVDGKVMTFSAGRVKNIVMVGGQGNDDLIVDDSHGVVGGHHELFGGDGNDSLIGDAGDDSLFGEAGDDSLLGGAGDDSLDGGDGNDDCDGGPGVDHVRGGDGVDHFHGNDDASGEIQDQTSDDINDDNGGVGGGHGADDGAAHHIVSMFATTSRKGVFA